MVTGCRCMEFLRISSGAWGRGLAVHPSLHRGSQTFEDVAYSVILCCHSLVDPEWTGHGACLLGASSDGAITDLSLGSFSDERWLA